MAFGTETGFGGTIFIALKGAFAQHFQQVFARQRGLLLPEEAAFPVARAEDFGLQAFAGVRVTQCALVLEKQREFFAQQDAREGFVVLFVLVALRFGKFAQQHFGGAAVVLPFLSHTLFAGLQAFFDLAAFAFGVFAHRSFFGLACPVEAAMFRKVVDYPRPLLWCEQLIQPCAAQFPDSCFAVVFAQFQPLGKQPCIVDQPFALEQARQFHEPPLAVLQAVARQPRCTSGKVERFAFFVGFRLVKAAHAKVKDVLVVQHCPTDGGDADVETKNECLLFHDEPLLQ